MYLLRDTNHMRDEMMEENVSRKVMKENETKDKMFLTISVL